MFFNMCWQKLLSIHFSIEFDSVISGTAHIMICWKQFFNFNTVIEFNINNISILAMQGNIMTQIIKLHAGGRKLIVCSGHEGNSLYYSLSPHNRLLYYPRVHTRSISTSQGKMPAKMILFCSFIVNLIFSKEI